MHCIHPTNPHEMASWQTSRRSAGDFPTLGSSQAIGEPPRSRRQDVVLLGTHTHSRNEVPSSRPRFKSQLGLHHSGSVERQKDGETLMAHTSAPSSAALSLLVSQGASLSLEKHNLDYAGSRLLLTPVHWDTPTFLPRPTQPISAQPHLQFS